MSDNSSPRKIHFSGITEEIRDIIGAIVLLAFAVFVFSSSFFIKQTAVSKVGSDVFPKLIGGMLIVIGAVLLIGALGRWLSCRRGEAAGVKKACEEVVMDFAVVLTPVYIIGYFLLMEPLGFILMTPVYLYLQIRALYVGKKMNHALILVFTVVFTVIVYLIFRLAFNLFLPAGILAGIING